MLFGEVVIWLIIFFCSIKCMFLILLLNFKRWNKSGVEMLYGKLFIICKGWLFLNKLVKLYFSVLVLMMVKCLGCGICFGKFVVKLWFNLIIVSVLYFLINGEVKVVKFGLIFIMLLFECGVIECIILVIICWLCKKFCLKCFCVWCFLFLGFKVLIWYIKFFNVS